VSGCQEIILVPAFVKAPDAARTQASHCTTSERLVSGDFDLHKAAAALLSQHGSRAVTVAEERASRYAIARETNASELWRAIAETVKQKLVQGPAPTG
jgi:hypothetical protein